MPTWFQALLSKEETLLDLFEAHARTLCLGAPTYVLTRGARLAFG